MISLAVASRSFSKHPVLRESVLRKYPDAKFNDQGLSLIGQDLVNFLKDSRMAITALETINSSILEKLPNLEVIGKYGVGLDMIDLNAMHKYNVKLGWTGGVNKTSVAELVISLSTLLLHKAVYANNEVKKGEWYQIKGRELSSSTVGVVGCGHIGKEVVKFLQPYGCRVLAHDILDFDEFYTQYSVEKRPLNMLLEESDVVTLHLPLDESTANILNKENIGNMKAGAILLNLARGGLVDEIVLEEALISGSLSGAALDVFKDEPPINNRLTKLDNVFVTPHIGGSTDEAILAMGMAAINGLENPKDARFYL